MKKRVFIIHGWGGSPDANWFPWLKEELEKKDFEVIVPQMPNADFPMEGEWIKKMHSTISDPNSNVILVGHSLGVISILRYLESLSEEVNVGGAILVAGFSESLGTISEIENFFTTSVNYEKVKSCCKKFIVISSDDDPYVPTEKGKLLYDKLDAKFILLNGAGHINMGTGYLKLPVVLEEILKMTK